MNAIEIYARFMHISPPFSCIIICNNTEMRYASDIDEFKTSPFLNSTGENIDVS
jgi:hypothetical protein